MSTYEIRIEGHLDPDWNPWMFDLSVTHQGRRDHARTVLTGPLPDQAALQAVIERLIAMNLTVISIRRTDSIPRTTKK
jgi:hypothetical protein